MEDHPLHKDPAIERFAAMRENTHQYFRFTPRKLPSLFMYAVGIPIGLYWLTVYSLVRIYIIVLTIMMNIVCN